MADLLINGIAFVSMLLAAIVQYARPSPSPVERSLRILYAGLAVLLGVRIAYWLSGSIVFSVVASIAASWLPLLALRLIEELMRRHAPWPLKWLALGGAVVFSIAALTVGPFWPALPLIGLVAFQMLILLWLLALVTTRARGDILPAEGRVLDTIAIAFAITVPLAVTDFRASLFPELPVSAGALGALILLVAASRLSTTAGSPRALLADLLWISLAAGLVVGGAAVLVDGIDKAGLARLFALGFATGAFMLFIQRLGENRLVEQARPSLLATLSRLPEGATRDAILGSHPLLSSAHLVGEPALALYDPALIARIAAFRVVTGATALDAEARAAADNLLSSYAATHLVRISQNPPTLIAIAAAVIGADGPIGDELAVVSRLAEGARS